MNSVQQADLECAYGFDAQRVFTEVALGAAMVSSVAGFNHLRRIALAEDDDYLRLWSGAGHLQTATDIQRQLLPVRYPEAPGYALHALSVPALEVGGDYYNFHWVRNDQLGVIIADVSGKGLPAALVTVMLASTFRLQSWGNLNVAGVLCRVNDFIRHALRPGTFITCSYGILDCAAGTWTWARAGHEALALMRRECPGERSVEFLTPDGTALGVLDSAEFRNCLEVQTVPLRRGDEILLFTDGLTEAMGHSGEEFGMDRIESELRDYVNREPVTGGASLVEQLSHAVQHHTKGAPLHDDLTFVHLGRDV